MSKDAAIAEIVKNLHNLNLEENQQILDFINSKKDLQKKKEAPKHRDKDGTILETGDEVFLLTGGVYNRKGEKGSVTDLPKTVGEYITFQRKRVEKEDRHRTYLRKLGKSVRKVPSDYDGE